MPLQIPLQTPTQPDIFSYGFDTSLNKTATPTTLSPLVSTEAISSPLVYGSINERTQAQLIKFGYFRAGTSTSNMTFDPTTGFWLGNELFASAPFSVSMDGVATAIRATSLTTKIATSFETAGRLTSTLVGSGTTTFDTDGLTIATGGTLASSAAAYLRVLKGNTGGLYAGSPSFFATLSAGSQGNGTGSAYFGLEGPAVGGTGHTFTGSHIGFKLLKSGSTVSLYATQADGTTENASVALTTVAVNDDLDLIVRVNGTTSASYWWKKNGGAISSTTTLTSNLPTSGSSQLQFSISNDNTTVLYTFIVRGAYYER